MKKEGWGQKPAPRKERREREKGKISCYPMLGVIKLQQ